VALRYSPDRFRYIYAKIASSDWPATLAKIEAIWRKIDNVHPIDAKFYNDAIEQSYRNYSSKIKVIGSLSFLAICIASIGLLGMVVFTTETRLKEISIRKVLGASVANLIFLMSKGFIFLLAIAALIALPLTKFYFAKVVLEGFPDEAPSSIWELTIGVFAIITIALSLIVSQTQKAARTNPADVLKSE
jgi:ABC-type antimicrobial peptide transport system permease subunit